MGRRKSKASTERRWCNFSIHGVHCTLFLGTSNCSTAVDGYLSHWIAAKSVKKCVLQAEIYLHSEKSITVTLQNFGGAGFLDNFLKNTSLQIILMRVPCIFYYFVLRPTNAQWFHKLSHSYMFRHKYVKCSCIWNTCVTWQDIIPAVEPWGLCDPSPLWLTFFFKTVTYTDIAFYVFFRKTFLTMSHTFASFYVFPFIFLFMFLSSRGQMDPTVPSM